ncbi:TIM barrel protein [Methylobacterium crusticola]|uniref:TIM barrel protein n=1 Tax=Methylobacterium crusticola TaxID=1697972 RepID=UPI00193AC067|nr:TIM barrel protein [Methylobacterium crusticola]
MKLLFHVFHCVSLGRDPVALIAAHDDLIAHVQIADHPGRHEPGSGTIDFAPALRVLEASRYDGHIGCEYHPSGRSEDSFGRRARLGNPHHAGTGAS